MDGDFWTGVRLVVNGLTEAAKKASYCLGFGAGGFGVSLVIVAKLGIAGPPALLISMSAFFITARLGKAVDAYADRTSLVAKKKQVRELQQRLDELEHDIERRRKFLSD